MYKTNASIRRFLKSQHSDDIPETLWDRYSIYVWAVACSEYPKSFNEWVRD